MGRGFKIGTVAGIPIRIHISLLIILPLLAILFGGSFTRAAQMADIPPGQLSGPPWLWGLGIAVGLFVAVLVHELAHSIYALKTGGEVRDITLFFIGGVSSISKPPRGAKNEAIMAAVGPLTSLAIGGLLLLLASALHGVPSFNLRFAVFYLGTLNLIVGAFNLLPAFPMDGGRILRAILTRFLGKVRATTTAAVVGKALALALGLFGLLSFNLVLMAIAFFVYMGADAERRQVLLGEVLTPLKVSEILAPAPQPIHEAATVSDAAARMREEGLLALPVVSGSGVDGLVTVDDFRRLAPDQRGDTPIGSLARRVEALPPSASAADAMERMGVLGVPELPVVDHGELVGMVSQERIARWLRLRELRDGGGRRGQPYGLRRREGEA